MYNVSNLNFKLVYISSIYIYMLFFRKLIHIKLIFSIDISLYYEFYYSYKTN